MPQEEILVEQRVLEYESRLKHFDELLLQAEEGLRGLEDSSRYDGELAALREERTKLLNHIAEIKRHTHEEWQEDTIEEVGPMIVWEAVAKRLESLVERIYH